MDSAGLLEELVRSYSNTWLWESQALSSTFCEVLWTKYSINLQLMHNLPHLLTPPPHNPSFPPHLQEHPGNLCPRN